MVHIESISFFLARDRFFREQQTMCKVSTVRTYVRNFGILSSVVSQDLVVLVAVAVAKKNPRL